MDVIKTVMEDSALSPVEKVLFAILYCRKEGDQCRLTVQEIIHKVGVQLASLQESLQRLEQKGFIRVREDCDITDASSFLTCTVLQDPGGIKQDQAPRP